ncbi:family 2A encapsulin nanocompartment cargo protein cysteine desulfurase [Zoogloea sp.]|uniref:family 2A encapsulin nanocompartment cargo protein cysteine desulfurase n=1 Tax=Zoogloea sp. TaxID=49181 RepID=UPI00262D5244|nr:family 2A encapsulin nanocompartment cargo protein cysteine desulfurase [Zoogloea sp.]MDD3352632.1 family 2A encapsulin nanocompartment cargo protein cysteine desulfurase [Zoogloea sp.]
MSIPTPTSEGVAGLSAAPAGLPDELTLARLAGEFFAALPNGAGAGAYPVPAALPADPEIRLGEPGPRIAPVQAPPRPSPSVSADPAGLSSQAGAPAPGVPEAYAAALPTLSPPASSPQLAPSTPYYFLGEASAYPSSAGNALPLAENRVVPQSFGLPGEGELHALLAEIASDRRAATAPATPQAGHFYFLDSASVPDRKADLPLAQPSASPVFDVNAVRRDFPILQERVNGKPLIWFDNAATTHKPQAVIDRLAWFYQHENSNIHRAAHELAARATDAYEGARSKVARFLGASSVDEIIFVRGATEGINLIAKTWGWQNVGEGDEIIVSHLEHHANIVPWQQLAAAKGARIKVIPVDDTGQVILEEYRRLLTARTRIVSVTQVSNALGTVVPVKEIVALAHQAGAVAVVDGAQSVSHMRVNVQEIGADFFVFSGHKVFAPTGIGAVYGRKALLDDMPPWQGGGNMIADVTFEKTLYHGAPTRFEAGTGNIADAVGLGAAIDYVERLGMDNIARYEHDLLVYATRGVLSVPGLKLIGTARDKASVLSFVLDGYRPEEVGRALNEEGIAVRSGHHCAQPILRRFGQEATVRPSLAFYNTCEEIDHLVAVLHRLARGKGRIGR